MLQCSWWPCFFFVFFVRLFLRSVLALVCGRRLSGSIAPFCEFSIAVAAWSVLRFLLQSALLALLLGSLVILLAPSS